MFTTVVATELAAAGSRGPAGLVGLAGWSTGNAIMATGSGISTQLALSRMRSIADSVRRDIRSRIAGVLASNSMAIDEMRVLGCGNQQ